MMPKKILLIIVMFGLICMTGCGTKDSDGENKLIESNKGNSSFSLPHVRFQVRETDFQGGNRKDTVTEDSVTVSDGMYTICVREMPSDYILCTVKSWAEYEQFCLENKEEKYVTVSNLKPLQQKTVEGKETFILSYSKSYSMQYMADPSLSGLTVHYTEYCMGNDLARYRITISEVYEEKAEAIQAAEAIIDSMSWNPVTLLYKEKREYGDAVLAFTVPVNFSYYANDEGRQYEALVAPMNYDNYCARDSYMQIEEIDIGNEELYRYVVSEYMKVTSDHSDADFLAQDSRLGKPIFEIRELYGVEACTMQFCYEYEFRQFATEDRIYADINGVVYQITVKAPIDAPELREQLMEIAENIVFK